MRIIFIRHGDPDYENDTLTKKGWREAECLSERVSKWNIDKIYCSPLGRAKDTASLSLKKLGREATVYEWLREFRAPVTDPSTGKKRGPWDFIPGYWTNVPEFYSKDEWFNAPVMQTGEVKSEYEKVCAGIDGILKENGYVRDGNLYRVEKHSDDTIVIFCHLGVTLAMLGHLLGISPFMLWHGFFIAPTSVTVLATEEREDNKAFFRCQVLGDTQHLHDGNEPVSSSGYYTDAFQG